MLQVKCIQKYYDKYNNINGYLLQDNQGNTKRVYPKQLKEAINKNKITVENLKLTSDNKLIDVKPQLSYWDKSVLKYKVLGLCKEIDTNCGHKVYFLKNKDNYILYIPDDVTDLYKESSGYNQALFNVNNTLKVVGGKNLKDAGRLCYECYAKHIDFSEFETHNITSMEHMFYRCNTEHIDLSNFDTSNVTNMDGMFYGCEAYTIDLSSFDTSHVKSMTAMFRECFMSPLDLSHFNTSNVNRMDFMFRGCGSSIINISSFNTSKVNTMKGMFMACGTTNLDLRSFDTSNVKDMHHMFEFCAADVIDISSFIINDDTDIQEMFKFSKSKRLVINSKDKRVKSQILIDNYSGTVIRGL